MRTLSETDLQVGELYYFTAGSDAIEGVWGFFDCSDEWGRPCLEIWSRDFVSFERRMTVPVRYDHVRSASREELRDFAYNMGYARI